jgi:holin-like protein
MIGKAALRARRLTVSFSLPMLYAITALFALQLLGEAIVHFTHLPLPGALVGTLLLLAALIFHGRTPQALERVGTVLLQNMMLLFIPVIAGVMLEFDNLARQWQPFVLACIIGAAITFIATLLSFRWMLRWQARKDQP